MKHFSRKHSPQILYLLFKLSVLNLILNYLKFYLILTRLFFIANTAACVLSDTFIFLNIFET